jgi:endonuclease-3
MTASNRGLLTKVHKVLKKHYKPVAPAERPLLEQLLFAACLENAHFERAEQAFASLLEAFFDWNEVRVSTVKELAEALQLLPDPMTAAGNLRRLLQSVFESTYSFELESLRKQNLGVAIKQLEKLDGSTPFTVAYVTQTVLGGHSIPIDRGALDCLLILGIISESEHEKETVPGLERTIPKNKGVEFGGLLHQLSADFSANPQDTAVHKILLEISPDAKERLPKRSTKKAASTAEENGEAASSKAQKKRPVEAAEPPPAAKKKPAADMKKAPTGKKQSPAEPDRGKPAKQPASGTAKRKPR